MAGGKSKGERRPYWSDESRELWDPRTFEPAHRNLADAIRAQGMTQETFAGALGVSTTTVERWVHGHEKRENGYHLSNGELLQAARLLHCNVPYLLDLTTDPQPATGQDSLPGNIGQYERGRRFVAEWWRMAKDPAKLVRSAEQEATFADGELGYIYGYEVARVAAPARIGAAPSAAWEFYDDEGRHADGWTDWEEEVFRICGDGEDLPDVPEWYEDANLFEVNYLGDEARAWFLKDYRERTAARLRTELLAIPGDYRSLVGVCRTMLDRIERTAAPEEIDRLLMSMTPLYDRAADTGK